MKQTKSMILFCIIAAILIAVLICLISFGVFSEMPNIQEIDSETLLQIKQDYIKSTDGILADDVEVLEYCGTYDGCIVMMLSHSKALYQDAIVKTRVAGIAFQYNNSNQICVWKDGEFYTLEQAYGEGLLSRSDIRSVRNCHIRQ